MAMIIAAFFISLQIVLFIYSKNIKENWDKYNSTVETKMAILAQINIDFGYGGAIHNFKNFLIRGNHDDIEKFNLKFDQFIAHKNSYLKLDSVTPFEIENIKDIHKTMSQYKNNIYFIHALQGQNKDVKTIDSMIKVDDTPAIEAMNKLQHYFKKLRSNTTTKIHDNIYTIYYISILVIILIFVMLIYLGIFFEKTILKPIIEIESGLISFFKFLSNKKHVIKPIDVIRNDEFGIMARSINNNIVLATNLHNDITVKNNELNTLLYSYGQNVIASSTDLEGIITYVSEAFEQISGFTKEELLGQPHSLVRHPDMPKAEFQNLWETIKSGKVWEGEVKNRKKNGEYYLVKATVSPLYDSDANCIGYSSIREDITQHKQVEILNEQLDVYKNHLQSKVKKSTSQIKELMVEIEDTQKEVVFTMGAIGERRSEETGNHVKRVAEYSKLLALYYGLDEKEAEMLKQASPMHDIGKVGVSDAILNKPGKLTHEEYSIMQEHAQQGFNMLKASKRPLLKMASIVAHEHHEKYDGSGYPQGLKGEHIHIYGRITALADVFDALGSNRCYKKAWEDERIFSLFYEEKGKHFDPQLVDIFFLHIDEFLDIRDKFTD